MSTLADQLRKAMSDSERTRYRISIESGISQSVLSRFVNKECDLSLCNVEALCKALGIKIRLEAESKKKEG